MVHNKRSRRILEEDLVAKITGNSRAKERHLVVLRDGPVMNRKGEGGGKKVFLFSCLFHRRQVC